jgi:hypothetical protein
MILAFFGKETVGHEFAVHYRCGLYRVIFISIIQDTHGQLKVQVDVQCP